MRASGNDMFFVSTCSAFGVLIFASGCGVEQCPRMTVLGSSGVCTEAPPVPAVPAKVGGTGQSCTKDADCKAMPAVCMSPDTCQGQRPVVACEQSKCVEKEMVDDDSACGDAEPAQACDLFKAVFCNGEKAQPEPECPESCTADEDCDEDTTCTDGKCVANGSLRDGADCTDSDQCRSGHCSNDVCCQGGDCCENAAQCRARFASPPACNMAENCQGTRKEAVCQNHTCSSETVDDDSACNAQIVAKRCTETPNIMCSGGTSQAAVPPCAAAEKSMSTMPMPEKAPAQQPPAQKPAMAPPTPARPAIPSPPPSRPPVAPAPKCTGSDCCTTSTMCTGDKMCIKEGSKTQVCAGATEICRCLAPEMMSSTPAQPAQPTCDGIDCCSSTVKCTDSTKMCVNSKCVAKTPACEPACAQGLMCVNTGTMDICSTGKCECVPPPCTGNCCVNISWCGDTTKNHCIRDDDNMTECLGDVGWKCHGAARPVVCSAASGCCNKDTKCGADQNCVTSGDAPCGDAPQCHCMAKPPDVFPGAGDPGWSCTNGGECHSGFCADTNASNLMGQCMYGPCVCF